MKNHELIAMLQAEKPDADVFLNVDIQCHDLASPDMPQVRRILSLDRTPGGRKIWLVASAQPANQVLPFSDERLLNEGGGYARLYPQWEQYWNGLKRDERGHLFSQAGFSEIGIRWGDRRDERWDELSELEQKIFMTRCAVPVGTTT